MDTADPTRWLTSVLVTSACGRISPLQALCLVSALMGLGNGMSSGLVATRVAIVIPVNPNAHVIASP